MKILCLQILCLLAASDVFRAMITNGMKETRSKSVDMKEYSNLVLEQFLEFVYRGEITEPSLCLPQLWALIDK